MTKSYFCAQNKHKKNPQKNTFGLNGGFIDDGKTVKIAWIMRLIWKFNLLTQWAIFSFITVFRSAVKTESFRRNSIYLIVDGVESTLLIERNWVHYRFDLKHIRSTPPPMFLKQMRKIRFANGIYTDSDELQNFHCNNSFSFRALYLNK